MCMRCWRWAWAVHAIQTRSYIFLSLSLDVNNLPRNWRANSPSSEQGLLLVPLACATRAVLSRWWAPLPGMASLLDLHHFSRTSAFTQFSLLKTVLILGEPLSGFLKEVLYKWSIRRNEVQSRRRQCRAGTGWTRSINFRLFLPSS